MPGGNFWSDFEMWLRRKEDRERNIRRQQEQAFQIKRGLQDELVAERMKYNSLTERTKRAFRRKAHEFAQWADPLLDRMNRVSSDNLFGADIDEDGNLKSRRTVTRSGRRADGGSGRGRTVRSNKGVFEPDKYNRPENARRDRLGALNGKQQAGKAGGNWGGFGGSGVKGAASSYELRSALYTAKNMQSRVKLTTAGFLALTFGDFGRHEMDKLNKSIAKAGRTGGLASLNDREAAAAVNNYMKTHRFFKAARSYSMSGIANIAQAGLGLWDLAFLGAASVGGTHGVVPLMKASAQLSEAMEHLGESGWDHAMTVRDIQLQYGSYAEFMNQAQAAADVMSTIKTQHKIFSDAANDIAGDIIGVSGGDVLSSLKKMNALPLELEVARARRHKARVEFIEEMMKRAGTKE